MTTQHTDTEPTTLNQATCGPTPTSPSPQQPTYGTGATVSTAMPIPPSHPGATVSTNEPTPSQPSHNADPIVPTYMPVPKVSTSPGWPAPITPSPYTQPGRYQPRPINPAAQKHDIYTILYGIACNPTGHHADAIPLLCQTAGEYAHHKDWEGNTLLHVATHPDTVWRLAEAGLYVDEPNNKGQTPIFGKSAEVIDALLLQGANIYAEDNLERTALFYAPDVTAAKKLVANGLTVNTVDEHGYTPLSYVLSQTPVNRELVEYLKTLPCNLPENSPAREKQEELLAQYERNIASSASYGTPTTMSRPVDYSNVPTVQTAQTWPSSPCLPETIPTTPTRAINIPGTPYNPDATTTPTVPTKQND